MRVFDNASPATDNARYDDSAVVRSSYPFHRDETISFTAERDRTYYVAVTESNANPNLLSRANYSLTVTSRPGGDSRC